MAGSDGAMVRELQWLECAWVRMRERLEHEEEQQGAGVGGRSAGETWLCSGGNPGAAFLALETNGPMRLAAGATALSAPFRVASSIDIVVLPVGHPSPGIGAATSGCKLDEAT